MDSILPITVILYLIISAVLCTVIYLFYLRTYNGIEDKKYNPKDSIQNDFKVVRSLIVMTMSIHNVNHKVAIFILAFKIGLLWPYYVTTALLNFEQRS